MVKKEIVVRSHPASAHHLISALEACARHDIYWSNEFFYRWLTEAPQPRAWKFQWRSLVARHPNNVSLDVEGRRFVVKMRQGAAGQRAFLEQVAGDPHLPGAAVAWARWLAQAGRETEALKVVKDAYAGIEGSRLPWDFHILRNQITALEWRIADKKVPRGLQRYLGDDDGHMAKASEATCNDKVAPQALGYFMGRAALRLGQAASEWAAEAKGSRSITYVNPEMLFPGDYTHRVVNFIDNAHMSDSGQRRLAEYFAGYILKTDVNAPFNPAELAAAVHAEAIKLSEQPSRKSP